MPEAVDLGLSVKWASFNIGASKEYEYGDYYAWGETTTKDNYDWASYKWCTGYNKLTKYCPKDQADKWDATAKPNGPDGEIKLLPSDDVAHVKLGGKWRIRIFTMWGPTAPTGLPPPVRTIRAQRYTCSSITKMSSTGATTPVPKAFRSVPSAWNNTSPIKISSREDIDNIVRG